MSDLLWKTKLAAWLHDPAEKALTLLRDRTEGHEWGTVKRLREALDIPHPPYKKAAKKDPVKEAFWSPIKRADWYASAADRPQFPLEDNGQRYAPWTQVNFAKNPILKHPLTAAEMDLGSLDTIDPQHLKAVSEKHFKDLIVLNADGTPDLRKTLLNYWRFAPESPAPDLNHLWQNLPADTRVPDHSIWSHLDTVSALSGAMLADKHATPSLMAVSFGPVQGFIAEARSTSDLWAGSHLLARIAWEGMKVICEKLGPDAIIFPNLRGVPLVDVWLRDEGLPEALFEGLDWAKQKSDANPLFGAALPNRFVAVVPADQTAALAQAIEQAVRQFMLNTGKAAIKKILEAIDEPHDSTLPCYAQLDEQLQGFPEVHWAAVPWSLAETSAHQTDAVPVKRALSQFYPEGHAVGFVDSKAWQVLQKEITLDGARFYAPNPGTLYPALYELLDRVAAAAKATRPFEALTQQGHRSSLNGEREWLTLDRQQLKVAPGKRENTLWTRLAKKKKSWVKKGEHLDALNAIKRLWPVLFTEEVKDIVGNDVRRYVLSTHTLAVATALDKIVGDIEKEAALAELSQQWNLPQYDTCLLPMSLHHRLNERMLYVTKRLPSALDDDEDGVKVKALHSILGSKPEAYYGIILFDGDHMGAWLAGNEATYQTRYRDGWHPHIKNNVQNKFADNAPLQAYLDSKRWPSPARHAAISEALNQFSLRVARFVVEECFKGKLVYAGGDDVLAFVCVDDLLPAMTLLRYLYSGKTVPEWLKRRLPKKVRQRFDCKNGYLRLDKRLLLTMGENATGSCGALVVHHQMPLGHVLKRLRQSESQAKNAGDRNAFCLKILKRAGGDIGVTEKWYLPEKDTNTVTKDEATQAYTPDAAELLFELMQFLAREGVSRRATYHSVQWLNQLPNHPDQAMVTACLAHQFKQQSQGEALHQQGAALAEKLVNHAYATSQQANKATSEEASYSLPKKLADFLMVGEFLARESRLDHETTQNKGGKA